jgi:NADPH:quinone reductase-like Zn-dependent oxidoreductase
MCLSPVEASVHYTPLLIAYFAYVDLARVKPGQTVLITDASHCAGPSFVQLGKALGAKVIAATKCRRARLPAVPGRRQSDRHRRAGLADANQQDHRRSRRGCVFDGLGGPQMSLLGDVLAPRGSLVLYGLQGGNQTPFPACAAFQKNIQFFVHCIGNFTGKPELGIAQDQAALQRALREINQLTADGMLVPLKTRVFAFSQFVEAHRYMDECPCRERVALQVEAV